MARRGTVESAWQANGNLDSHLRQVDGLVIHPDLQTSSFGRCEPPLPYIPNHQSPVRTWIPDESGEHQHEVYQPGGHPMQRQIWTPQHSTPVSVSQSHYGIGVRNPPDSNSSEFRLLPFIDGVNGPLQPVPSVVRASGDTTRFHPGYPAAFQGAFPIAPVSLGQQGHVVIQCILHGGQQPNEAQTMMRNCSDRTQMLHNGE